MSARLSKEQPKMSHLPFRRERCGDNTFLFKLSFITNQKLKESYSPSLTAKYNQNKTLGRRTQGIGNEISKEIYEPYNAIVSYYDKLGILHMYNNSPTFKKRYDAMIDERDRKIQLFIEQETSLGVGRQ